MAERRQTFHKEKYQLPFELPRLRYSVMQRGGHSKRAVSNPLQMRPVLLDAGWFQAHLTLNPSTIMRIQSSLGVCETQGIRQIGDAAKSFRDMDVGGVVVPGSWATAW